QPVPAARKRREIGSRAAELFDREGYHTTNLERLAERVSLRKPTLYHYFASKEEILFWIHEEFIDLVIEKQRRRPPDLVAREALREVMSDLFELMDTHRGYVRVFFEHHRELSGRARTTIARKRDAYEARVGELVQGGHERG